MSDDETFTSTPYRPADTKPDNGANGQDAKPDNGANRQARFPLTKFGNVLMASTAVYLVKSLIPRTGLVVIWGPPKCGKSFWVFDLLMHVALGSDYRGLRVKQGLIVYCALEGVDGFRRRIEAFRRKYPKSKDAPFYLIFTPLDLTRDHKALIASIRAQLPKGVNPSAVAIDTLNRSLHGSESSDEDMANYVRAGDAIGNAFGCVVPIIHHCGHSAERPRGHSSLLGAADVQIAVKRDAADNIVATVELAKDGAVDLEIVSRLVPVEVGQDEDGVTMTSCIIEPVDEPAAKAAKDTPRLTKGAKIALRALHEALDELGEVPPASNHIPAKVKTVHVEKWRTRAYQLGISGSPELRARQLAFQRAHEVLIASRQVAQWENLAWVP